MMCNSTEGLKPFRRGLLRRSLEEGIGVETLSFSRGCAETLAGGGVNWGKIDID